MQPLDLWNVFVDFSCITLLLLVGLGLRTSIRFVRRIFVPASVIGGFGGLILGPHGVDVIPFSAMLAQYPGVLIAVVFAALPFTTRTLKWRDGLSTANILGVYSAATMLFQWGLGLMFSLVVLSSIWPDLPVGFGAVLASGFVGGHGTAAAVGATFADHGWPHARDLAMTSATVGILSAVVGGMLWVQWAARRGNLCFLNQLEDSPQEDRRIRHSPETLYAVALKPLVFHVFLIVCAAVAGGLLNQWSTVYLGPFRLPTFCLAFLCGAMFRQLCNLSRISGCIDRKRIGELNSVLTDILVVSGISAIDLQVVGQFALPLTGLFIFGLVLCWALFYVCGPLLLGESWFEKGLYTWGWVTGVMAMALALIRLVDPDNESSILDDFALAYLFLGPLEVALVSLAPILIVEGHTWAFIWATVIGGFGILACRVRMVPEGPRSSVR